jgi:hypothetical protein
MIVPQSWNQITVSQFLELRSFNETHFDSVFEYHYELLDLVLDCDELEDLDIDSFTDIIKQLWWLRSEPPKRYSNKIGSWTVQPFVKVTWGEFLDLEMYGQNYIENLATMAAVLLRETKPNEWGHPITEPYNYNELERGQMLLELPITSIYGIVAEWIEYRNKLILVDYKHLFDEPLDEEEDELTTEEKKDLAKDKAIQRWSYEKITLSLANNDVTKMLDVTNLSLIMVLNMLSMQKDLG